MLVTAQSSLTGVTHTRDLDITTQQMCAFLQGTVIQDAFPHLSASDREFLITGSTDEEWDAMFKESS